jgi:hypothetical protein
MTGEMKRRTQTLLIAATLFCTAFFISCKSSGNIDILGPSDETSEAANIILDANKDLKQIKVLYEKHENKREELKKAMLADDADTVKKIADDVVYIINDGVSFGTGALDKIDQARALNINDDYQDYLRLKSDALKKQLEAYEQYRQAAISLRNNYDPKNTQLRDKVKADFKERSENFQAIMEKARDSSNQANELAKDVMRRKDSE